MLGVALLFAAVEAAFRYREGALQWVVVVLGPVWVGTLVVSLRRLQWRSPRARMISAVLMICLAVAPFLGARGGILLRDAVFRSRLPEYEAAVRDVQAGVTPPVSIFPRLAHHITQTRDGAQIAFIWGRGFPLRMTSFVHSQTDLRADSRLMQPGRRVRVLAPHWYAVSE